MGPLPAAELHTVSAGYELQLRLLPVLSPSQPALFSPMPAVQACRTEHWPLTARLCYQLPIGS